MKYLKDPDRRPRDRSPEKNTKHIDHYQDLTIEVNVLSVGKGDIMQEIVTDPDRFGII